MARSAVSFESQLLDANAEQSRECLGVALIGPGAVHLPASNCPFAHTELPSNGRRTERLGMLSRELKSAFPNAIRHIASLAKLSAGRELDTHGALAYGSVGVELIAYGGTSL